MNHKLEKAMTLTLGALLLLFAAYLNGFPLVYSDTSTYLDSGFQLETPFDRPIMYGLLLRLCSLNGASLWLTIFFQGLTISYLVFELLKLCAPDLKRTNFTFLGLMAFLSIFTSASWTTSLLIADVYTPILILSFVLLVIGRFGIQKQVFLYFIFFIATATHLSHVSFVVILVASVLILRRVKRLEISNLVGFRPLLICISLALASILTMGSALSKSKHGFLMGALVEHGVAKAYLDEHCSETNYKFCAYKDSLPDKAWQFLWEEDSPFYKMGGWKGTKTEFNEIIYGTLTDPAYITMHIEESVKATADQLSKFKLGDGNGAYLEGTMLHKRISRHFEHEVSNYESSLQSQQNFYFLDTYNGVIRVVVILSLIVLIPALVLLGRRNKKIFSVVLIIILAVFINAWACGTLANAIDRLGAKVIWLLPLIMVISLVSFRSKKI